ncbi:MAG: undecaprenyl-diphosphate phosphatase [Opitutales bacterium]
MQARVFRLMGWIRWLSCLGLLSCLGGTVQAQPAPEPVIAPAENLVDPEATPTPMGYPEALLLGLVEGITEYLPISSTGHLLITNTLLGLDADTPLYDANGLPRVVDRDLGMTPENFYTVKHAADAYAIVIQFGAILAVTILYWARIRDMVLGIFGKNPAGRRLAINLVLAFLPAAFFGFLLDDWIESQLFYPGPILFALFAGALLMFAVEHWRKRKGSAQDPEAGPDLHELSARQCLAVGLLQCVAMWPGTSRSMMTIVGGYLVGLNPKRAAEFSFLLGLITLTAASGYKFTMPYLKGEPTLLEALDPGPVLFGVVVSAVSAALAVRWLVGYLTRHGLGLFAWYRIGLVLVLGGVFWATDSF